jgi:hypothetical protein
MAVPHLIGARGERQARQLTLAPAIEQAELDLLRVRRKQGEVDALRIARRTERFGLPWFDHEIP